MTVMDHANLKKMIADLENLGTPDSAGPVPNPQPLPSAPESLKERVLARIDSEPAKVTTDREGRVTSINPAFSGLCGFSFGEICGKKPGSLLQGEDTDPEAVSTIRRAVRDGVGCTTEMVNYHKDGSRYRVRIWVEPIHDSAGELAGFQAVETKLT